MEAESGGDDVDSKLTQHDNRKGNLNSNNKLNDKIGLTENYHCSFSCHENKQKWHYNPSYCLAFGK